MIFSFKKKQKDIDTALSWVRPWGEWMVISRGPGFKVKLLYIKPGEKISLQKHQGRDEHWTIISGVCSIEIDDAVYVITDGDMVSIYKGQWHQAINTSDTDYLVICEVQLGETLLETDIERMKGHEYPNEQAN